MDGLTLLRRARDAGLDVAADGNKVVIRGPKRAEAIARLLIEHKPEVMAALAAAERTPDAWNDSAPPIIARARAALIIPVRGPAPYRPRQDLARVLPEPRCGCARGQVRGRDYHRAPP